jgi:hypothetical protein
MNAHEVDALVEASLAGARSVHTGHVTDAAAYVAELDRKFRAARVFPEPGNVVLEREAYGLGASPGEHAVFFVCRSDPQSVFFDPKSRSFGCAWGPDLPDLKYIDLGFRSQDVLEMLSA